MSKKEKSIHDFDFNLICEYFSNLERQGPGSSESTLKALSFVDNLNEKSKILDIGCGTGNPTFVLAQNTKAKIIGLDLFPIFINLFNDNARKLNLKNRVLGMVGSMDKLPFPKEEFDLIWSEGSIYNIGFQKGLKYWKKFLKKDGYLAISEASWFTEKRPKEIDKFWKNAYKEIDTIGNKVKQIQQAGYIPVAIFNLKESCWLKNFYEPQVRLQKEFLKKHKGNEQVEGFINNEKHEASLYKKYKKYYGYTFYIIKKI